MIHSLYSEYLSITHNVFLFGVLVLTCFLSREQNSRYGVCYECILTAQTFAYLELQQKMHNEISFERLLYKHTESLLNLDITTFCFLPLKKKKLRHSNNRLILRKPQHRFYTPPRHITTTTKGFYFVFKGRNRTAPNVFMEKLVLICLHIAKIKYKIYPWDELHR